MGGKSNDPTEDDVAGPWRFMLALRDVLYACRAVASEVGMLLEAHGINESLARLDADLAQIDAHIRQGREALLGAQRAAGDGPCLLPPPATGPMDIAFLVDIRPDSPTPTEPYHDSDSSQETDDLSCLEGDDLGLGPPPPYVLARSPYMLDGATQDGLRLFRARRAQFERRAREDMDACLEQLHAAEAAPLEAYRPQGEAHPMFRGLAPAVFRLARLLAATAEWDAPYLGTLLFRFGLGQCAPVPEADPFDPSVQWMFTRTA